MHPGPALETARTPTQTLALFFREVYTLTIQSLLQLYQCKGAAGLQDLLALSIHDKTEKKGWENTL